MTSIEQDIRLMRFGVFDHLDASGQPLGPFYENRLLLAEAYDRLGFHALHTAEHHFTPLGMAPSPSVYHAAIAQRTRRLLFGPLVYTLNLYHPLRLAEEICMLDHMSGGRFQLGVGRGISPFEVGYFGADASLGQEMYVEAFEVLMKALAARAGTDSISHTGRFYNYHDVPIELSPLQRPHPPLWYGIGNPESVDWCVRHRVNVVTNAPFDLMRRISDGYREAWSRAGHSPASLPCIGSSRHVVIADTDAEAERIARRAYTRWRASFMHLFKKHNASPRFVVFTEDFDEMRRGHVVIAGTAATVRDEMRHVTEATGLNYVLCRFAFGDMTLEESMRSTEQFAAQVMPAFAA